MKSKRLQLILLAFNLGLVAAVIGCATRSEAPATKSGQPNDAGWAFADTQSDAETASHAKVAETESHAKNAESAEALARREGAA